MSGVEPGDAAAGAQCGDERRGASPKLAARRRNTRWVGPIEISISEGSPLESVTSEKVPQVARSPRRAPYARSVCMRPRGAQQAPVPATPPPTLSSRDLP